MDGTSQQTQTQQSTTQPWQQAQPLLGGILSQLGSYLPQTGGITGAQSNAIGAIENNADGSAAFTPQINNVTSSLLAGGGALRQAPQVQAAYNQYGANTSPLANNTNYNPMQTPGIGDQLQALRDNITQSVNGSFAAAGRDGSGYNQKALASGLAAGLAPVLTNQYNQNVQNQQTAAGNLYNAGNTNAGILSGLQQQYIANQGAGVGSVSAGLDASNAGPMAALQAEAQRLGIPLNNLGLISNIGIPIAGLGSQSSGTATGTNTMSGAQQFGMIAGGANSLVNPLAFLGL